MALRLNGSSSGYVELDVPAAAGSHTLTLPDGGGSSGQYLQTNGSGGLSWAGAGKILQVVNVNKSDFTSQAFSPDTFYDITGLSLSITPSSTSSKVLVFYRLGIGMDSGGTALIRLLRNGTAIGNGNAAGQRLLALDCTGRSPNIYEPMPLSGQYLDSPSSTSELTYKLQWGSPFATSTFKLNASFEDADNTDRHRQSSTFTLMEVGA